MTLLEAMLHTKRKTILCANSLNEIEKKTEQMLKQWLYRLKKNKIIGTSGKKTNATGRWSCSLLYWGCNLYSESYNLYSKVNEEFSNKDELEQ